jgi:LacI family transcriptional regulator
VPQGLPFLERLLRGITDYSRQDGGWTFTRLPEALGPSVDWLRHWSGDGAFVLAVTPSDARTARRLGFPVVNLASHLPETGLPTVVVDHGKIGEVAARHLLDRRFRRFGFYGAAGLWYSQLRRDGFRETVRTAGGSCHVLEAVAGSSASGAWRDQQRQLETWLRSLRPPVGIMASTDLRAGMVLEACHSLGLKVPEQVALVGVDNDPVFAEFHDPTLTSVSRNDHEVGLQAGAMLAELMRRGGSTRPAPQRRLVLVPPDGIVLRGSTATLAIDDPIVDEAVRLIRKHIHKPFGLRDVLKHVPLSRRAFEYRFRAALGSSPYHYINRVRVDLAREFLADPKRLKLSTIATACGFRSLQRFRLVFHRIVGQTPSEYRRHIGDSVRPNTPPAQVSRRAI